MLNDPITHLAGYDKNGIDAQGVYLSRIFDWYREDFEPIRNFLRDYRDALADNPAEQKALEGDFSIRYVDYNWGLNSIANR